MRYREFITELGDKPYTMPKRWKGVSYGHATKQAILPSGKNLDIEIHYNDGIAIVNFYVNGTQTKTGEGDAVKIFSTVGNEINDFVRKYKPQFIAFTGSEDGPSRIKLYDRIVDRWMHMPVFFDYDDLTGRENAWPQELFWHLDDVQQTEGQKIYVLGRLY
jgi:hypothetical protein